MQGRVHKYEGQRGVSWFYVHDAPANASDRGRRQVKRRGFATKRAAQEALTAALREVDTGSFVERSKLTVGEFLQHEWLPAIEASGVQKSGTIDQYRIYIRVRVMPAIGGITLQDLDATTLDRFYVDLGHRLAPKSVRNTALMMSTALKFAVKRGRLSRSPAPDAHMPKAPRTTMQYWAPEETKAFLDSARDDRLYALWFLFATTGMRRGEAMAMRWDDVDFDRSRVSIQRSLVVNSGVREDRDTEDRPQRPFDRDFTSEQERAPAMAHSAARGTVGVGGGLHGVGVRLHQRRRHRDRPAHDLQTLPPAHRRRGAARAGLRDRPIDVLRGEDPAAFGAVTPRR